MLSRHVAGEPGQKFPWLRECSYQGDIPIAGAS